MAAITHCAALAAARRRAGDCGAPLPGRHCPQCSALLLLLSPSLPPLLLECCCPGSCYGGCLAVCRSLAGRPCRRSRHCRLLHTPPGGDPTAADGSLHASLDAGCCKPLKKRQVVSGLLGLGGRPVFRVLRTTQKAADCQMMLDGTTGPLLASCCVCSVRYLRGAQGCSCDALGRCRKILALFAPKIDCGTSTAAWVAERRACGEGCVEGQGERASVVLGTHFRCAGGVMGAPRGLPT